MKNKVLSAMFAFVCIIACSICFTACGGNGWEAPKRIVQSLPETVHVEYSNTGVSTLPSYCILVKEGNLYYVKTPHKYYSSNRLEVLVKANLKNGVVLDEPQYSQGHISARWSDYENKWVSATEDSGTSPNAPEWHANDQNGSVYYTGIGFLDVGYGSVNHTYENGVTDKNGYTHTATQVENQTVTLASGQQVECVVWEYSFTTSDPNSWTKEKYWFEKNTGITIKMTSTFPSSLNQSLDADDNIDLVATYFATNETMESYLSQPGIDKWPVPDFSSYI